LKRLKEKEEGRKTIMHGKKEKIKETDMWDLMMARGLHC
jgi:hypothetical protein